MCCTILLLCVVSIPLQKKDTWSRKSGSLDSGRKSAGCQHLLGSFSSGSTCTPERHLSAGPPWLPVRRTAFHAADLRLQMWTQRLHKLQSLLCDAVQDLTVHDNRTSHLCWPLGSNDRIAADHSVPGANGWSQIAVTCVHTRQ